MNPTQVTAVVTPLIGAISVALATKFGLDANVLGAFLSSLVGAAAAGYQVWVTRKTALVTTVANLPEVKKVELDPTVPGSVAVDRSTPSNVVTK